MCRECLWWFRTGRDLVFIHINKYTWSGLYKTYKGKTDWTDDWTGGGKFSSGELGKNNKPDDAYAKGSLKRYYDHVFDSYMRRPYTHFFQFSYKYKAGGWPYYYYVTVGSWLMRELISFLHRCWIHKQIFQVNFPSYFFLFLFFLFSLLLFLVF